MAAQSLVALDPRLRRLVESTGSALDRVTDALRENHTTAISLSDKKAK